MKNNYIDLFSGAGGLGEGFQNNSFSPVYINDMDSWALKTCQLRKAYHKLLSINEDDIYYDYIQKNPGDNPEFFDPTDFIKNDKRLSYIIDSLSSDEELHQDNLSTHFSKINRSLNNYEFDEIDIIAGGPPCQAYSLAARSRFSKTNDLKWGTKKENKNRRKQLRYDKRHQLYELYLEIVKKYTPKAFVYENVPSLLTATSKKIISAGRPSYVINQMKKDFSSINGHYDIIPLKKIELKSTEKLDFKDFIINASDFGVPQHRKRFIMVGFRKDLTTDNNAIEKFWNSIETSKNKTKNKFNVEDAIASLPPIKSKDGSELLEKKNEISPQNKYEKLMNDKNLKYVLNHKSRSHMEKDLERYEWYSNYALKNKKNATLRDLPERLFPNHKSATNFLNNKNKPVHIDRFKVQLWNEPSKTITAHIKKDGHAYIHPDPVQNRSLTVREVARLQSFPDNYAFCGPRGAQFQQIGNAVPPLLSNVIAGAIKKAIT